MYFKHISTGRLLGMETEAAILHCQGSPYWEQVK
jgi:hypothetical protein